MAFKANPFRILWYDLMKPMSAPQEKERIDMADCNKGSPYIETPPVGANR